ncbi:hypothetical protein FNW52_10335 [Flavobacterium sp. ZT3R18]|uniref:hypothetical protein n=1 Tax=Flavobacterium sp. ZT3R18 TaxID=2594429 RepID=UPI00117AF02B|nr:hypothetical protein [Flavobacterium sp. ZT3R18]TRX35877.1 hypothetical protein FNW52_10335 [Flavobacterium sp. ZT3R18]
MGMTSNYCLIENEIAMCIGGVEFNYKDEFEVFIEKYENKTYDILINKLNREVFGAPADCKFEQLYEQTTNTLLPIALLIEEESLQIRNGRNRSLKALDENRNVVDCHGIDFDYIEQRFWSETDTVEKIEEYTAYLNIIKALSISLQKQEDCENHKSDWGMALIAHTYWDDVQTRYDKTNNCLKSISDTIDIDKLMEAINEKILNNQLPITALLEKDKIKQTSTYEHFVQYRTKGLDFIDSKTCVKIAVDDLIHFKETIVIHATLDHKF